MTYPKTGDADAVPGEPAVPGDRGPRPRVLGRRRHVRREHRRTARPTATTASRRQRVRLLRRPAVRQRPAALRPPAHRLRQGRRPALPDDARPPRRAPLRLGLPRPAGRGRGREAARARPASRRSRRWASPRSTTPAAPPCSATRRTGRTTSTARRAGWTSRTTTRRSTWTTWKASCGPSRPCGTRAWSTRASACSPTAGATRRRCRNTETRMDDVYRQRQDPAVTVGFRLLDGPAAGALGLIWTTTPWTLPSNLAMAVHPDLEYVVLTGAPGTDQADERFVLAAERVGALRARARRRRRWPRRQARPRRRAPARRRAARHPLPAAVRFFAGRANAHQVLAADYVTTDDGTGIVHIAPAFGEEDKVVTDAAGIEVVVPVDAGGKFTAEVRAVRRAARVRRQQGDHRRPQGRRRDGAARHRGHAAAAARDLRPPVPALLALRQPADLPRGVVVVRQGDGVQGPHGRAQPADHLGAGPHQGRLVRQVAGERPRLVDQPQPVLGLADPGLGERRPGVPAGRRLRLAGRAGEGLRRPAGATCTGRTSTT